MDYISINLLPPEILNLEKEKGKKGRIVQLSIALVIFMIIITSIALAWRIFQHTKLNQATANLSAVEKDISAQSQTESLVVYLHQRIGSITPLLSATSKQAQTFNLISGITPQDIKILFFSADKDGNATITAVAPTSASLSDFFDKLLDPDQNQGTIKSVHLDSLSQSADNLYRVDLTVNVK